MNRLNYLYITSLIFLCVSAVVTTYQGITNTARPPLVLMTDFGLSDGAVSAMKGVAYTIDQNLMITDLTHAIEPFNIHEAAYRLYQVMQFYPTGTTFVCVVDPGVGTVRRSIIAQTNNNYFVVTPDNGILSYIDFYYGIKEVRCIDEKHHRLAHSEKSHTFHGRDVYAYVGAKLASQSIRFDDVGPIMHDEIVKIPIKKASVSDGIVTGSVVVLDPNYGNVWTDIEASLCGAINVRCGDTFRVTITNNNSILFDGVVPFCLTFGSVAVGKAVVYTNSLGNIACALNQKNFGQCYHVQPGATITVTKATTYA